MGRASREVGPLVGVVLLAKAEEDVHLVCVHLFNVRGAEKNIDRFLERPVDKKSRRVRRVRPAEL